VNSMMHYGFPDYEMPPYRPPSEAMSLLIRASRGCPWNKCQFCTMYKTLKFHPRPVNDVKLDIDKAAKLYPDATRVFIGDSDSLSMKRIDEIIGHIKKRFSDVERITSYARAKTLMRLKPEKLKQIRKAGLTRVHVGLESGDPETLRLMDKGATPEEIIMGGKAAKEAGLELCFYVLVGAGGKKRLKEHALGSASVCNNVNPNFIRLRTLIVQRGSLLETKMKSGLYENISPIEKLEEVSLFIGALDVTGTELVSDHITNYIWIDNDVVYNGVQGHMPRDKKDMLELLNDTIKFISMAKGEVADSTMLYERGLISSL
jgi:radical SAM superfamily enzyme YgiQ (UPF0313 family)